MRISAGSDNAGNGASSTGSRFEQVMQAERDEAGGTGNSVAGIAKALDGIVRQMQELIQQLAQLIQSMSAKGGSVSGASSIGADGRTRSIDSGLGGAQGPSERIPDPTQNVRQVQLGGKTMTIGSDGSASAAEVDAAAAELQRMYDVSPTFRSSIDGAGTDNLTVTLGRRGDNISWGGGGRVFLNLNNIDAGNNDRFQGIVGHEFGHAANGLPHGAELDAIESRVRTEA